MKIYKLKYTDRETAITDLINKGVYDEDLLFGDGIQAVVEIGLIISGETPIDVEPTYLEGYHYDIMSENEIIFESEIITNNPKHTFAGYEI